MAANANSLKLNNELLMSKIDTDIKSKFSIGDLHSVGSIVYSMLSLAQFQSLNGTQWVLADGSTISTSSDYYIVRGVATLPDLRGVFLRGKNNGKTGTYSDQQGERALDSLQDNALPNLTGSTETRYFSMRATYGGAISSTTNSGASYNTPGYGGSVEQGYLEFNASLYNNIYDSTSALTEVRLSNVCLNAFIKINY